MALQGPFPVEFGSLFPSGVYAAAFGRCAPAVDGSWVRAATHTAKSDDVRLRERDGFTDYS